MYSFRYCILSRKYYTGFLFVSVPVERMAGCYMRSCFQFESTRVCSCLSSITLDQIRDNPLTGRLALGAIGTERHDEQL
jgi:hypothetical protein